MYNEVQKKKAAARAKKNLEKNYKHAAVNVRNEQYTAWQEYAEKNGISIRALIIESVEHAIQEDYFNKSSEEATEKVEEK